ncbi:MAG: hypothetical protein K0Q72_813 [Armatimonadetes bacterium]|jgi:hypothetical protein|nr:hypothetical protein [Armatimonadota bacterium]
MEVLSLIIPLANVGAAGTGAYLSFCVCRTMVTDIFANDVPLPAWLEAIAPLKGRWLRLFIAAPGIVSMAVFVFAVVTFAVVAALAAVGAVLMLLGSAVINGWGLR